MSWRQNIKENGRTRMNWKGHGTNKWGLRIEDHNYIFVIINPLPEGRFELKYIDAEMKDYSSNEKEMVRLAAGLTTGQYGKLALAVTEHYGHYEWIEQFENLAGLSQGLEDQTSFPLTLLEKMVSYEVLKKNGAIEIGEDVIQEKRHYAIVYEVPARIKEVGIGKITYDEAVTKAEEYCRENDYNLVRIEVDKNY